MAMNELQKKIIQGNIGRLDHLANKATLAFNTSKNTYTTSWGEEKEGYSNDNKTSKAFAKTCQVFTKISSLQLLMASDDYHPDNAQADMNKLTADLDKFFDDSE